MGWFDSSRSESPARSPDKTFAFDRTSKKFRHNQANQSLVLQRGFKQTETTLRPSSRGIYSTVITQFVPRNPGEKAFPCLSRTSCPKCFFGNPAGRPQCAMCGFLLPDDELKSLTSSASAPAIPSKLNFETALRRRQAGKTQAIVIGGDANKPINTRNSCGSVLQPSAKVRVDGTLRADENRILLKRAQVTNNAIRTPSAKLRDMTKSTLQLERKIDAAWSFKKSAVKTSPAWAKPIKQTPPKLAALENLTPAQKLGALIQSSYPSKEGWGIVARKWNPRTDVDLIELYNKNTGRMGTFCVGGPECKAAAAVAFSAVRCAWAAADIAWEAYAVMRTRRAVFSCSLKLILFVRHVRRLLREKLMAAIQARVEKLLELGGGAPDIEVNLITQSIELKKQIEFEGGCATIKSASHSLMEQIELAASSICRTCVEFDHPMLHFRVEGHTAKSAKSQDGGMSTSKERAVAVAEVLRSAGIPPRLLHPQGFGDSRPIGSKDQNRRVEIHVEERREGDDGEELEAPSCNWDGTHEELYPGGESPAEADGEQKQEAK